MGEVPLTVAFGSRGEFNILDVRRLVDMDRYRKINVDARRPEELYPDATTLAVENNVAFLRTCVREFPVLNLAHRDTGRIYARFERGRLAWRDAAALIRHRRCRDARRPPRILHRNSSEDRRTSTAEACAIPGRPTSSMTLGRWRDRAREVHVAAACVATSGIERIVARRKSHDGVGQPLPCSSAGTGARRR